MSVKYLEIKDEGGQEVVHLQMVQQADGSYLIGAPGTNGLILTVSGLALTTAGVTDALNKRFCTDAQKNNIDAAALALAAGENLLASNAGVNLNSSATPTLYTVPVGKTAIITKIIIKGASVSLTTWSGSFGWTGTTYADVVADAKHTTLTAATMAEIVAPMVNAIMGVAAGTLKLKNNTLQGVAATADILVFGILF
jgi:hypothetical protein